MDVSCTAATTGNLSEDFSLVSALRICASEEGRTKSRPRERERGELLSVMVDSASVMVSREQVFFSLVTITEERRTETGASSE